MNFKSQTCFLVIALILSACSLDQPEQPQQKSENPKNESPQAPAAPAPSVPAPIAEPEKDAAPAPAPAPAGEHMNLLEKEVQSSHSITILDVEAEPKPAAHHSIIEDIQNGVFDSNAPAKISVTKIVDLPPLGQRFWLAASTSTTVGERLFFQKLMDDPDAWSEKDSQGRSIIHILAEKGKAKILKLLHYVELDRGFTQVDNLGRYPAHYASNRETIDYIWDNTKVKAPGGKRYLSPATSLKDSEGKLPLHVLIEGKKTQAALVLIDKLCAYSISAAINGSGINSTDSLNRTPLHYAAITNNASVTDALINCEFIQRDPLDSALRTPLHYAAEFPDFAAGYVLTVRTRKNQSGAEIFDRDGKTPLDIAIEHKNEIGTAILSRPGN